MLRIMLQVLDCEALESMRCEKGAQPRCYEDVSVTDRRHEHEYREHPNENDGREADATSRTLRYYCLRLPPCRTWF